jgi:hypothetical protein
MQQLGSLQASNAANSELSMLMGGITQLGPSSAAGGTGGVGAGAGAGAGSVGAGGGSVGAGDEGEAVYVEVIEEGDGDQAECVEVLEWSL